MPTAEDDEIKIKNLEGKLKLAEAAVKRTRAALVRRDRAKALGIINKKFENFERRAYEKALDAVKKNSDALADAIEEAGKPDSRRKKKK